MLLLGLNIISQDHWLDSDMAAEMIFSRILSEEHHIFSTTNWYYSTEFRVLYTQLIMGPLFRICSNWHVIRTITNLVFYGLMLASYYYFMKPLKVSRGLTVLRSCLLLLPFSETMMTHMQMGNTYMSHVILVLWFFGMYLRLCSGEYSAKRKVSLWIFYVLLAIVCGMSGVRYLLALQCPLVLTSFFYLLGGEEFQSFRGEMTKEHFRSLLSTDMLTVGGGTGIRGKAVLDAGKDHWRYDRLMGVCNTTPLFRRLVNTGLDLVIGRRFSALNHCPHIEFVFQDAEHRHSGPFRHFVKLEAGFEVQPNGFLILHGRQYALAVARTITSIPRLRAAF